MNIQETLEKRSEEELQVITSFNTDNTTFYILAITKDGLWFSNTVKLSGSFDQNLDHGVTDLANDIRVARQYLDAKRKIRSGGDRISQLRTRQNDALLDRVDEQLK